MNPAVVYLAQTDTTAGFLSQSKDRLTHVKERDNKKDFIISIDSFKTLKNITRIPQKYKKFIRKAEKTTIVYPKNLAIRVVKNKEHLRFLKKIKWAYSTSSNQAGQSFQLNFAKEKADVIIYNKSGFDEKNSSIIIKCGKISKRRLR
jgi:tRNA A37 threonylcarbamoyladenosine synthetase subunit TsaC/SUA5/YrdC